MPDVNAAVTRADLDGAVSTLRNEMAEFRTEVRNEMATKTELAEFRTSVDQRFDTVVRMIMEVRTELRNEMAAFESNILRALDSFIERVRDEIRGLDDRCKARNDEVRGDLDAHRNDKKLHRRR